MALLASPTKASPDASTTVVLPTITGLLAGEDLIVGPCYIKASDNKIYNSNGTAADEAATTFGFNIRQNVKAGEPVTLFPRGTRLRYGTGLTVGAKYYIGTTKGRLDTAATIGDAVGVARAITDTDIQVIRDH